MPGVGNRLGENALKIQDLCIVPWSQDQETGDLITSLNFVIDSLVSQVQQDTSIGRGGSGGRSFLYYSAGCGCSEILH